MCAESFPFGRSIAEDNDLASTKYPATPVAGHLVHVFWREGAWEVWINCEDLEFTGLCIGSGATRDAAVGEAVQALERITEFLQGPPPGSL